MRLSIHAEESIPVHSANTGTSVREWLILGPVPPGELDSPFSGAAVGKISAQPKEGDTVTLSDGKQLVWKRYRSGENYIALLRALGTQQEASAFAFCFISCPNPGSTEFRLASRRTASLWINQALVLELPVADVPSSATVVTQLSAGTNACFLKLSNGAQDGEFDLRVLPPNRAIIQGTIHDPTGNTVESAEIRLLQKGEVIAESETDSNGNFELSVFPSAGIYDLRAQSQNLGAWRLNIPRKTGSHTNIPLNLQEAISISGIVRTMNSASRQVAVPIQAISVESDNSPGPVTATVLTDDYGEYRFNNLRPGSYRIRCQTAQGFVYYGQFGESESETPHFVTVSPTPFRVFS